MQNGYVGSFNGRMGNELLKESLFFGPDHGRRAYLASVSIAFDTSLNYTGQAIGSGWLDVLSWTSPGCRLFCACLDAQRSGRSGSKHD